MRTIKYTLLCLVAFLLWNGMVKGQSSFKSKFNRHIISLHEISDFNLTRFGYELNRQGGRVLNTSYFAYNNNIHNNGYYNFSIGINYEYRADTFISINTGIYFSKQAFKLDYLNPITYKDSTYSSCNYYVSFFYFPIGIKLPFLNKYKVRPSISLDLINAFMIKENAILHPKKSGEIQNINSNTIRYYFLKPQITLGCDYYFKKYKLGVEIIWKGIAFFHIKNTYPTFFKFTNLCVGLSFGYAIK